MTFKAVDPHRASIPDGDNGLVAFQQINTMLAEVYSQTSTTLIASVASLTTSVANISSSVASLSSSVTSLSTTVNEIVAFKAGKNGSGSGNQTSLTHQLYTKVTFPFEFFDDGGYYDSANSRWTPPAGLVCLSSQVWISSNVISTAAANVVTKIWKNGQATEVGTGIGFAPAAVAGAGCCQVPGTLDKSTGTDYYEAFQYGEYFAGTDVGIIDGNPFHTWFSGHLVKRT